jgi:LPXTG-site transpeptidase (sortase) family protein
MSQSTFARFPHPAHPGRDHNPHAADQARQRIAALPNSYMEHAAPAKEELVGEIQPVSPAAEGAIAAPLSTTAPEIPSQIEPAAAIAAGDHATIRTATNPLATPAKGPAAATDSSAPSDPVMRRSLPSRLKPLIIGLATFVILFFLFQPQLLLSQLHYFTKPQTVATPATQAVAEVPPSPTISIPKISVNAPVVYATANDENDILTDLESGVVHYAGTALPGQPGNSVIFGHSSNNWWDPGNYKFVFVLLDKLVPGDTFTVNYNSHQYLYQVTSSTVVDPTDVAVLDQTSTPEMTLITCSPPGTSWKRLVVVAKQISPAPTSATQTASSAATKGAGTLPSNAPSLTDTVSSWWHSALNLLGGSTPSKSTTTTSSPSSGATLPATQ